MSSRLGAPHLVFVSDDSIVSETDVLDPIPGSDHNVVKLSFLLKLSGDTVSTHPVRYNFVKADREMYNTHIRSIDWVNKLSSDNVDNIWNNIKSAVLSCVSLSVLFLLLKRRR